MSLLYSLLLMLHIMLGSAALLLFWIPAFTRKGSLDHVKFGRYYANTMYMVAGSGLLICLLVLAAPLHIHGNNQSVVDVNQGVLNIRLFAVFLLYVSWLTLTSVRHGMLVLRVKQHRHLLRRPMHLTWLVGLTIGGLALLGLGLWYSKVLHIIFGVLGAIIGGQMLLYCFRRHITPRQWWIEHLGAMIGSGIGAYTAFITFGARQLLAGAGYWQLLFWVAPGVIGALVIGHLSRRYHAQFQGK
ncbi:hypothetical protein [Bowmanella pacifica]|uniref:Membrane protein n=1 Tax=Bowmanella pacifica TaxID=502051 RepID=A0A918DJK3_9ALTE|nr:hypothetical protein [Bowmanella pacifica]GGO68623.1 membrane protein [Bowmanella pacifica]